MYFKLKEFEKWQVRKEFSDLLFSAEASDKTFLWDMLPYTLKKGSFLISKDEWQKESKWLGLAKMHPVYYV